MSFDTVNQDVAFVLANFALLLVLALLSYLTRWLKAHASARTIATLTALASVAVKAAEQIALTNTDKFISAATSLRASAAMYGFKLSDEQIKTLVEHAVHELKIDAQLIESGATTLVATTTQTGTVNP